MSNLVLAHAAHWYHSALYILPVVLIAIGLWWSGRRDTPAQEEPD
jgi:hypothetical protein